MAVAFETDQISVFDGTVTATYSTSVTVNASADAYILVIQWEDQPSVIGPTLGGNSPTEEWELDTGGDLHSVHAWVGSDLPASGSQTLDLDTTGATARVFTGANYSGVDQTNPVSGFQVLVPNASTPDGMTITSTSTDDKVMGIYIASVDGTANGTELGEADITTVFMGGQYDTGADGDADCSWTLGGTTYNLVGVNIRSAVTPTTVLRLDDAESWNVDNPTYFVSAETDRLLVVGIQHEGNFSADQITVTYGTQSMTRQVFEHVEAGGNDNEVVLFTLDDSGIAAASSTTIAITNEATNFTVHAASYYAVDQSTPVPETNSDEATSSTPNPITTSDISVAANNAVVALAGCGNATTASWGADLREQTDQQDSGAATTTGSMADGIFTAAETADVECTWASQNRAVVCAMELAFAAAAADTGLVQPYDMLQPSRIDRHTEIIGY